jgi:hypothetical protein
MRPIKLGRYLRTGITEKIIVIKLGENLMEGLQWLSQF